MDAVIKDAWGDGRCASVLDDRCVARPCLSIGENKGTYSQGRGYTSYYKNPQLVCMTRHCRGCPHPLPEPDGERVRCCRAPDFPTPRAGARPYWQRCRTCGKRLSGVALELARALPKAPAVRCDHAGVHRVTSATDTGSLPESWVCSRCKGWWDGKPEPYVPGETAETFNARRMRAWRIAVGLPPEAQT